MGAPHVSRHHCSVEMSDSQTVNITDASTNGTVYDGGILKRGEILELKGRPVILHFGQGVTVGVCFSLADEELFREKKGSPSAFKKDIQAKEESFSEETSSGDQEDNRLAEGTIKISNEQRVNLIHEVMVLYDRLPPVQRIMVALVALILAILLGAVLLLVGTLVV